MKINLLTLQFTVYVTMCRLCTLKSVSDTLYPGTRTRTKIKQTNFRVHIYTKFNQYPFSGSGDAPCGGQLEYLTVFLRVLERDGEGSRCLRPCHSSGRLFAGFPLRQFGFEARSGHVGFVVDKVTLGQVFSEYFDFPCQF
jgi:hypothetical protein